MFSGCAIMNDQGLLGLPESAIIYYYTAAGGMNPESRGKKFTIRMAYSLDGGKTLIKSGKEVLKPLAAENRDPKVFWHEPSSAYIMVLYLENQDFGIFRSTDLLHFELASRVSLEGGFECPGLFCLPVYGNGADAGQAHRESRWVFWAADGSYYVGDFDGYRFTQTQRRLLSCADGKHSIAYAAQSFAGLPEERTLLLPWLIGGNVGGVVTHAMGFPRDLTLVRDSFPVGGGESAEEYHLAMSLPEEIRSQFGEEKLLGCGESAELEDGTIRMRVLAGEDFAFELRTRSGGRVFHCSYRKETGFFLFGQDRAASIMDLRTPENLEILYDRGIVEISADRNLITRYADFAEVRGEIPAKISVTAGNGVRIGISEISASD